jgi:hypothetical protein
MAWINYLLVYRQVPTHLIFKAAASEGQNTSHENSTSSSEKQPHFKFDTIQPIAEYLSA